ncbi:hypothetical protein AJ87_21500 [Rhizobium yanglingense]|nr:hypothetical protein AJ87_21500 [Rhizobium yanglingense]
MLGYPQDASASPTEEYRSMITLTEDPGALFWILIRDARRPSALRGRARTMAVILEAARLRLRSLAAWDPLRLHTFHIDPFVVNPTYDRKPPSWAVTYGRFKESLADWDMYGFGLLAVFARAGNSLESSVPCAKTENNLPVHQTQKVAANSTALRKQITSVLRCTRSEQRQ